MKRTGNVMSSCALCSLTLLMGVAQASSQDISFVKPLPEFANIICGDGPTDYTFTLINNRNSGDPDKQITLTSSKIYAEDKDSFENVSNFINITGGTCIPSRALYYGETCTIEVEVNPTALTCEPGEVLTGTIDRQLVVNVNTSQGFLETPIDFKATALGPVEQFALFGPNIFNGSSFGEISVSEDVGYTDSFLTPEINYQSGATFFTPLNPITIATVDSLQTVYNSLFGLTLPDCDVDLGNTLAAGGVSQTIYPGSSCFSGKYPAVIDGPVYLSGGKDDIFVLYVDYSDQITNNEYVALSISEGAYFTLAPDVNPNNVFILLAENSGSIEMCENSAITANVLSYGTFEAEATSSSIKGRILLLGDADGEPDTENCETYGNPCIALESNTIIAP